MNRLILAVACVALVGCSSSGGTGGGAGGGGGAALTFVEFCDKYLDTFGAQASNCNGGPKDLWVSAFNSSPLCADQSKAIAAMRASYDAASAQACINAIAAVSCTSANLGTATLPECDKTVTGKVAIGATCYGDIDCGKANYCAKPSGTCMGSCKAQIAAGSACALGDDCVDGYFCSNSTCTLNPAGGTVDVGGSCASASCKRGLMCNELTRVCANAVKEGQSCVFGQQLCEFFTACSASSNTCVRYPQAGGNCGRSQVADGGSREEYVGCIKSSCKTVTGSPTGTCAAYLAENAACTFSTNCASNTCTASKCAAACVIP